MKTIGLVSAVTLVGLLLVTTIHAAPSCCDPKQGQAPQPGLFPIVPQAGNTAPVAPRNTYTQQVPQTARELGPASRNPKVAQPAMTYFPAAAVPIQTVIPQTNPAAAASGPCGCGAPNKIANYQVSRGSCCGGNASYGRTPAEQQVGALPNCCAVGPKTAAPVLQVPKDTGKAASSRLPLSAQPAVVQADVPSNLFSAMKITTNGRPVLRFGSLW